MEIDFTGDMDNIFLDSEFQELISYTPDGGSATSINAIVFRDGLEQFTTVHGLKAAQFKAVIVVSKTDITTVSTQSDKASFTLNGATEVFRVRAILQEDQGAFYLGLT